MERLIKPCLKMDCFGNEKGECTVLTISIKNNCPFYKTQRNVTKGKVYKDYAFRDYLRKLAKRKPKKGDEL